MDTSTPLKVAVPSTLNRINKHWSPKLVASLNSNTEVKLAKVLGDFVWHSHSDTDELFYVVEGGPLTIQFEEKDGGDITLMKGDMLVIPKGVRHCPKCDVETSVLLVEGMGTVNTEEVKER